MSGLIDADALCEYANNTKDKTVDANDIMRFPTVDAVKVVRCKDCKEWTQTAGDEEFSVGRCEFLEHDLVMNKGFCAWGVRKDDEDK